MEQITRIAVATSKSVFTLHGADAGGHAVLRRNPRRRELLAFFEKRAPVEVVLEACGGAHHWGRALMALGHCVRPIPPKEPALGPAKPDPWDAEAISVAAARPAIGSVPVKSIEQQASAMPLSVRELLVRQRATGQRAARPCRGAGHRRAARREGPGATASRDRCRR